jgi:hypothetical protein
LVEAGINLTGLGVAGDIDRCSGNATFMIKTRSSQSFTAELKDFAIVAFPLEPTPACAIEVVTEAVCPGDSATFSVTETSIPGAEVDTFRWTITADRGNPRFDNGETETVGTSVTVLSNSNCFAEYTLSVVAEGPVCDSEPCKLDVSIEDTEAPVFSDVPVDATVECDNVPVAEDPAVTDNCDPGPNIDLIEESDLTGCGGTGTITRTWTATDACGNSSTASQTISVVDTTAPEISELPEATTIECPASPVFAIPTADDACDDAPTLTPVDVTTPGDCPQEFSVTRTWTATDACGNSSTASQTISVVDTTAPEISELPEATTIECPASPEFAIPTASDACDPDPDLDFDDVTTPGACPQEFSVTRTWTATDACNNISTASQTISVVDTTAPELLGCPSDMELLCGSSFEFTLEAFDNCGAAVITCEVTSDNGSTLEDLGGGSFRLTVPTSGSATVTCVATDDCGNTSAPCVFTASCFECAPCDGGVTSLTLQYLGDTPVDVVFNGGGEPESIGTVQPDGTFTVNGTRTDGRFDSNNVTIDENGVEAASIHVSCSQPIHVGSIFGNYLVTSGTSRVGGRLCPLDGDACDDCSGGVTSLELQYNGTSAADITATSGGFTYNVGSVGAGGTFTLDGSRSDGKFENNTLLIFVDGVENADIHVSCSQPIGAGSVFGDFTVLAGTSRDGGALCPIPPLPPTQCDVAAGPLSVSKNKIDVDLNNLGTDQVITQITVTWPESNGKLKKVKLGKKTIVNRLIAPTSATITQFDGNTSDRTLDGGRTERLRFEFERTASKTPADYTITVEFSGGCAVTVAGGS